MSMPAHPPAVAPRIVALDTLRAVAVLAMVMGHTLDATLSPAARALPAVQVYWVFRGVTAPLFLCVAGWAMAASVARAQLHGTDVLRRYLPRVALLLACGLFLRWPGWGLPALFAGEEAVWAHFLGFDALHCVGGSLLLASLVFACVRGARARLLTFAALLVLLPLGAAPLLAWVQGHAVPLPLRLALVAPPSAFPLVPWAGYFFSGVLLSALLSALPRVRPSLLLLGLGGALAAGLATVSSPAGATGVPLFFWRLALMLGVGGGVLFLPALLARPLAPVGRASLWAYVLHLPLAYGWSTFAGLAYRVGPTRSFGQSFLLALAVLAVSVTAALLAKRYVSPLKRRLVASIPALRVQPAGSSLAAGLAPRRADVRS